MRLGTVVVFVSSIAIFGWVLMLGSAQAQMSLFSGMAQPWNDCDKLAGAYLVGCHPPTEDPCDPSYAGYHINQTTAMLAQRQCATQRQQQDQQRQAQIDDQERQAASQRAEQQQQSEQRKAVEKAVTHGYEMIRSVKDLMLDGKQLANRNAKIQISGIYKKIADSERLYATPVDAFQSNDNYVPVLTDDAVRDFREYLLEHPLCQEQSWGSTPGCRVDVGGHMTMCHHLAAEFAHYPDVPCLNVEVQIVFRPGD